MWSTIGELLAKQHFLQLSDRKSSFVNYLCSHIWQPPFMQAYFTVCAYDRALLPCTIHSRKRRRPPTVLLHTYAASLFPVMCGRMSEGEIPGKENESCTKEGKVNLKYRRFFVFRVRRSR